MKRRTSILCLVTGLTALAFATGCTEPADPVAYGELCLPTTDACPDHVELERTHVGRNALEFSLRTQATGDSTALVRATTDRTIAEDELGLSDPPLIDEDEERVLLFEADYPLAAGEIHSEFLSSFDLTVASRIRLELECVEGACDHRLDYLYFIDSLECVDDDVCGRREFCERQYGRCAECSDDEHCDGDQRCDRETGYCNPGETTGCSATDAGMPNRWSWLFAIALLSISAIAARRRRRLWAVAALVAAAASILVAIPSTANADAGASMHVGGGVRVLTGEVGELTHPGWGITVSQQLRLGRLGTNFSLSTNSFGLTEEAAIERSRLTGYGVTLAPQFYIPIPIDVATVDTDDAWEGIASVAYTRWGVAENRLARVTGLDLNYHAIGPTLGLRWRWGDLKFTSTARYLHIFDWPGSAFTLDLTVGFTP